MTQVTVEPLTAEAFAPFGQMVEAPPRVEPTASADILDYWATLADFSVDGATEIGVCRVKERALVFDEVERHVTTPEVLVPVDGDMIVPVAAAHDLDDPDASPDAAGVRAFLVKANQAIAMAPGVWHWAPWPVGQDAMSFFVFFGKETAKNDLVVSKFAGGETVTLATA